MVKTDFDLLWKVASESYGKTPKKLIKKWLRMSNEYFTFENIF